MCCMAKEAGKMVEQWSEHIRELYGSLEALCVAPELSFGKVSEDWGACASNKNFKPSSVFDSRKRPEAGLIFGVVDDDEADCWIYGHNWSDHCTLPMICADCEKEHRKKCNRDALEDFALMYGLSKHVHMLNSSVVT